MFEFNILTESEVNLTSNEIIPNSLILGDCLEVMKYIPDRSVDMILCDPPYGTTACKWDSIIPFEPMWEQINRVIKPNGAIALFGSEPFSSALRMSNIKNYKYDWVWKKEKGLGFLNAKKMPLRDTENISIFYKNQPIYNPQMRVGKPYKTSNSPELQKGTNREYKKVVTNSNGERYPLTTLEFKRVNKTLHPTQKPVALLEYLIKTYTLENEIVLDFTMGSGSTGVAAMNTGRKFIGIEKDEKYFEIAKQRIEETINKQ